MSATPAISERIEALCHQFRLPTVAQEVVRQFEQSAHGAGLATLLEVLEMEAEDRRQRRVDRLRRAASLPLGKTMETLECERLGPKLEQQLIRLATGEFADQAINVLAFGMPGTGKTHSVAALGHRLVEQGRSVLFTPTYRLVQHLLAAKRDLDLPRALRKLDHFDVLILDDLGDVKQHGDEAEVLFTLIAERYERRSIVITSNVVFSQWEGIFQSPMATAAAIDRIVHHSVILEFDAPSYRSEKARSAHLVGDAAPAPASRRPRRGTEPSASAVRRGRREAGAGKAPAG
ncbi:MAG: IS21-like element helper ATPase IstB [Myxococcota bacterium]|nr:IS21-like element helper ATPase IstB [Myxococcota bacterium]MCZ7618922.1 IS21-like element helper ATPase IstB [Myxococcota bacterium]